MACPTGQIVGASVVIGIDTTGTGTSYTTIGYQKSCTLTMNEDTIETSNKDTPLWREYLPGYRDWSIDADAMLVETDPGLVALENIFLGSDPGCIYVAIKTPSNTSGYWTGNAIIKSLKYSAPDNGVYTASISLTGTGTLTRN